MWAGEYSGQEGVRGSFAGAGEWSATRYMGKEGISEGFYFSLKCAVKLNCS